MGADHRWLLRLSNAEVRVIPDMQVQMPTRSASGYDKYLSATRYLTEVWKLRVNDLERYGLFESKDFEVSGDIEAKYRHSTSNDLPSTLSVSCCAVHRAH